MHDVDWTIAFQRFIDDGTPLLGVFSTLEYVFAVAPSGRSAV